MPWDKVIEAAEKRAISMKQAGLEAFVKTSGGKGLHVVAPLKATAEWPDGQSLHEIRRRRDGRRQPRTLCFHHYQVEARQKILIDYLQQPARLDGSRSLLDAGASGGAAPDAPYLGGARIPRSGQLISRSTMHRPGSPALRSDPWEDFRAAAAPIGQAKSKKGRAR